MFKPYAITLFVFISAIALATEEALDMEFLEWLGETAELENMGIGVDALLQQQEQQAPKQETVENTE